MVKIRTIFSYFRQNLFLILMKKNYRFLFTSLGKVILILLLLQGGLYRSSLYAQSNPNSATNQSNNDFAGSATRDLSAAQDDYMQVLTCYDSTVFNVLANDNITDCTLNELEISIIYGSVAGATTTINSNKNIVYFPTTGFTGHDTLEYKVTCNSETYIAKVFITVAKCPDNITAMNCYGAPSATEWGIKELKRSTAFINPSSQLLVGDVDGCGKNEIVAFACDPVLPLIPVRTDRVLIFDDKLNVKAAINIDMSNIFPVAPIAIADVDGCGKAEIFVISGTTPCTLMCFWYDGANYVYKPGFNQNNLALECNTHTIIIGDINGDGIPELFTSNTIYNAITGNVIATLPAGGSSGGWEINSLINLPVLADVDNDGILEIVCGNMVYKAYINEGSTALISPITIAYQAPVGVDVQDGLTSVADIDLDGYLDVVVTFTDAYVSKAYVWCPYKGGLLGQPLVVHTSPQYPNEMLSRAFIGDVDNDRYPEIAFAFSNGIVCYKYLPNNLPENSIVELWRQPTSDNSGWLTMSMFDFNQDGKQEIIYQDPLALRIVDGETGLDVATFNYCSYPVVLSPVLVDLTGEGYAQIIVRGSDDCIFTTNPATHSIRIFGSSIPGTWAPARKIWNQYAYNSVNINEDLTVPRFQMNPATVFPGQDGILGTADDVRPFNNFLQQQTLLNQNGVPFWTLPNIVWYAHPTMTITGNSAVFEGCIKNIGDAALQAPIFFTYYKNDTITANIIALDAIQRTLAAGDTLCFTFTINNWSAHTPIDRVWISVNDRNGVYPYQQQCVVDGRRIAIDVANHSAAFYANNVHYENLPDTTFCDKQVHFQAMIDGFNAAQDSIKWYIEDTEYEPARGNLIWNKDFETGEYNITMWIHFQNGEIISVPSTLNVRVFWTKIKNIRH